MKKLLLVGLIVLSLVTGCATFNKIVTNNELMSQLAVEAATARVIHDHPSWKASAVNITGHAIAAIDAKTTVSLADVESYVKAHVPWDKLQPEEQALVSVLITQVRQNLEDSFRAHGVELPESQLIAIREVLTWINETAARQATFASEVPK